MLATSPFGGVTMRQRQSSVTIDTHVPVISTGREPASGLRHLWATSPSLSGHIRTADSHRQRKYRDTHRNGGTKVPTPENASS
jgi:hypothetical protein